MKVPRIYWEYTTRRVLTMEVYTLFPSPAPSPLHATRLLTHPPVSLDWLQWVEGLKLTDHDGLREANLDTQHLVDMVSPILPSGPP